MMCSFAETLGLAPGFFFFTTKYSKRFYVMKLHAQGTTLDLSHPHVMGFSMYAGFFFRWRNA
jgi:hypothetical protein